MTATAESTAILQRAWSGRGGDLHLSWYDGDRKKPAHQKVEEAVARYSAKFGRTPLYCLASPQDAAELFAGAPTSVQVQARDYIPRNTFYIGESES